MPNTVPVSSLITLPAKVTVTTVLGAAYDPTGDAVAMGFTQAQDIEPTAWYSSLWGGLLGGNDYVAYCLVGPGGTVALPIGTYAQWVKIADNPESPVLFCGMVQIGQPV